MSVESQVQPEVAPQIQPQIAKKPMSRRAKIIGGTIGTLVVLFAIGTLAGPPKPTPAGAQPGGGAPAGGKAAPVTLLELSGNGTKNSQEFTTTAPWTLAYCYDCTSFGMQGNFQVYVYEGGALTAGGVNELGMKGSSTTAEYETGQIHLTMNSECSWSVKVTQP